jgi:hypothetical protein
MGLQTRVRFEMPWLRDGDSSFGLPNLSLVLSDLVGPIDQAFPGQSARFDGCADMQVRCPSGFRHQLKASMARF